MNKTLSNHELGDQISEILNELDNDEQALSSAFLNNFLETSDNDVQFVGESPPFSPYAPHIIQITPRRVRFDDVDLDASDASGFQRRVSKPMSAIAGLGE